MLAAMFLRLGFGQLGFGLLGFGLLGFGLLAANILLYEQIFEFFLRDCRND